MWFCTKIIVITVGLFRMNSGTLGGVVTARCLWPATGIVDDSIVEMSGTKKDDSLLINNTKKTELALRNQLTLSNPER